MDLPSIKGVIHLINLELVPETDPHRPMSNHAAGDRQCLFEFHVTYFSSPHFSGLPYFILMRTEPTLFVN